MRHFNPSSYFGGLDGLDTELTELLEDPRLSGKKSVHLRYV